MLLCMQDINPLPFAFAFATGAAWMGYGFVIVGEGLSCLIGWLFKVQHRSCVANN
jgi:hypothetical protein